VASIPLSLYLHFPWCVRKCPYCDFNSHAARGEIPEAAYIEALVRDLDFELAAGENRELASIFLGGGTPSLFSGAAITSLLEQVRRRLVFAADIEITLEANPGTADASHFRDYRSAGINRLSIGAQSLDATMLKRLGRIHGPAEIRSTVELARRAGFDNVNLDLMYALPEQTLAAAAADLGALLALAPEHISYYQLTLEPNTEFAARPPPLPDDDTAWAMQEQGQQLLAAAGYAQYEVSAYARSGRQSRHNLNYWDFGDYLGIGAGAHGKRTVDGTIRRRARHKHPATYLEQAGSANAIQEERGVGAAELPFEYCLNALRLNRGFRLADFEHRTGLPASALASSLQRAQELDLLESRDGQVVPTTRGRAHLNAALRLFLP
jgi:putative oxygen-independent coproporphyrinogen III oxidase